MCRKGPCILTGETEGEELAGVQSRSLLEGASQPPASLGTSTPTRGRPMKQRTGEAPPGVRCQPVHPPPIRLNRAPTPGAPNQGEP